MGKLTTRYRCATGPTSLCIFCYCNNYYFRKSEGLGVGGGGLDLRITLNFSDKSPVLGELGNQLFPKPLRMM